MFTTRPGGLLQLHTLTSWLDRKDDTAKRPVATVAKGHEPTIDHRTRIEGIEASVPRAKGATRPTPVIGRTQLPAEELPFAAVTRPRTRSAQDPGPRGTLND